MPKLAGNVAKIILYSMLSALGFMLIVWGVLFVQANNLVQDRLSDLVYIVSEENCLSRDGIDIKTSSLGVYESLLQAAETTWVKFDTVTYDGVAQNASSYSVSSATGSSTYYSYAEAPQRGAAIRVRLRATLQLPVFVRFSDYQLSINVPITKTFTTMGMKFYKDKG